MLRNRPWLAAFAALLTLSGTLVPAAAEDWLQYGKDEYRTRYTQERVPGPVTDIWTWEPSIFKSSRPFASPVVWKGRVISFSRENNLPYLVTVDARTGKRLWHRSLTTAKGTAVAREDTGPVMDETGNIYAYSTIPLPMTQRDILVESANKGNFVGHNPGFRPVIQVYSALDGRIMATGLLPTGWNRRETNAYVSRVFLQDNGTSIVQPPDDRVHWRMVTPLTFGPALLSGGTLYALSWNDLIIEWGNGIPPRTTRIAHSGNHPHLEMTPPARFRGFPPVMTAAGLLFGDDSATRILGMLSGGYRVSWHIHPPWSIGVPSVQSPYVFMGVGGHGAHRGLVCMDPGNGQFRWIYAPSGLPQDETGKVLEMVNVPILDRQRLLAPDEYFGAIWQLFEPAPGSEGVGDATLILPGKYHPLPELPRAPEERGPMAERRRPSRFEQKYYAQEVQLSQPSGHQTNLGVVLARQRVYGYASQGLVSLDQNTGRPIWRRFQPDQFPLAGIVAAREHLIVSQYQSVNPVVPAKLYGVDLETGRLEWSHTLPYAGRVVVGHGLIYLSAGESMTCFAPAERTFRMAIDSSRKEDYHPDPAAQEVALPAADGLPPAECAASEEEPHAERERAEALRRLNQKPLYQDEPPPTPITGLADATILRLTVDQPLEQLLRAAQARRQLAGDVPRVLVLDWLTPNRMTRLGTGGRGNWSDAHIADFIHKCERLAAVFQPDHFEIASEVNVFLTRNGAQLEPVRQLLAKARAAIKKVAPETKVLISYNAEVLANKHGGGKYLPFGDLRLLAPDEQKRHRVLAEEVDEVGLTTYPQIAYFGPEQLLPWFYVDLQQGFPGKPFLITRIGVRTDQKPPVGPKLQYNFFKRLTRGLYWLDAKIVAYPELVAPEPPAAGSLNVGAGTAPTPGAEFALKMGAEERPALEVWREMLRWKRVKELTAAKPIIPSR